MNIIELMNLTVPLSRIKLVVGARIYTSPESQYMKLRLETPVRPTGMII